MENALSILVLLSVIFYILVKFQRIRDAQEEREKKEDSSLKIKIEPLIARQEISAVEEEIKTAVPTAAGLFPHEIALLGHLSNPRARKNITQAWLNCFPVDNPNAVLESLVDRGFAKWDGKRVRPTEKGEKEVEDNDYVFKFQGSFDFSVWEMNRLLNNVDNSNPQRLNWQGLMRKKLSADLMKASSSLAFQEVSHIHERIGDLCSSEEKYQEAIEHYLVTVYLEANQIPGMPDPRDEDFYNYWLKTTISNHAPFVPSIGHSIIEPPLLRSIVFCYKSLGISINDLRQIVLSKFMELKKLNYPDTFYTIPELTEVVCASVEIDAAKLTAIYKAADERIQKKAATLKTSIPIN